MSNTENNNPPFENRRRSSQDDRGEGQERRSGDRRQGLPDTRFMKIDRRGLVSPIRQKTVRGTGTIVYENRQFSRYEFPFMLFLWLWKFRTFRISVMLLIAVALLLSGWFLIHPDGIRPQNIRYSSCPFSEYTSV